MDEDSQRDCLIWDLMPRPGCRTTDEPLREIVRRNAWADLETLAQCQTRALWEADSSNYGKALKQAWPAVERILADALGLQPQAIWPSRYDSEGIPLPRAKT